MDWLPIFLSWLPPIVIGLGVFLGKNWLKAWIDNRVAVLGQKEIESYRAEINAEKKQISDLRENVLSGQANRQSILDQRRIAAVERIWESVNELQAYRILAEFLQKVNVEVAAEEAPNDPTVQLFFAALKKTAGTPEKRSNPAKADEPFISPKAWALYKSYESITSNAVAVFSAFEHGVDPMRFLKMDEMTALAKTVLPHQSDFMDEYGPTGAYFLLDEIKQQLLNELRSVLEGKRTDLEQMQQAIEITKQANLLANADREHELGLDAQIPNAIRAKGPE